MTQEFFALYYILGEFEVPYQCSLNTFFQIDTFKCHSNQRTLENDVPQGLILNITLFAIAINNIVCRFNHQFWNYFLKKILRSTASKSYKRNYDLF